MLSSHDNILPDGSAPRAVSRPFNIGRGAAARPDRGRRMVTCRACSATASAGPAKCISWLRAERAASGCRTGYRRARRAAAGGCIPGPVSTAAAPPPHAVRAAGGWRRARRIVCLSVCLSLSLSLSLSAQGTRQAVQRVPETRSPHFNLKLKVNLKLKCRSEDAASPGGATEPYA